MATPPRDDRLTTPRPVMGDHPDLEEVEPNAHRDRPAPHRRDPLSPLILGGLVALLIVLVLLLFWVV